MRLSRLASTSLAALLALTVSSHALAGAPIPPRGLRNVAAAVTTSSTTRSGPTSPSLGGAPDVQVNVDPGNLVDESGPAIAVAPSGTMAPVPFSSILIEKPPTGTEVCG